MRLSRRDIPHPPIPRPPAAVQPNCGIAAKLTIRLAAVLVACAFAGSSSGCVHRRIAIQSDPPGATVLVEGEEIGQTPCAFDFTYYGTREFTLMKDGYETLTVLEDVRRPWYQVPPVEFVADNFSPRKINDRRTFFYRLKPQLMVNTQDLLNRATGIRGEAEVPQ